MCNKHRWVCIYPWSVVGDNIGVTIVIIINTVIIVIVVVIIVFIVFKVWGQLSISTFLISITNVLFILQQPNRKQSINQNPWRPGVVWVPWQMPPLLWSHMDACPLQRAIEMSNRKQLGINPMNGKTVGVFRMNRLRMFLAKIELISP